MPIWPFGRKNKKQAKEEGYIYPSVRAFVPASGMPNPFASYPALDEHFRLSQLLEDAPVSQQEEIARDMVAMSAEARKSFKADGWDELPHHRGYYRLAVNYEKQKRYKDAIQIAKRAKKEGWAGDWDKRIERCQGKLDRATE